MLDIIEAVQKAGVELPVINAPAANYVGYVAAAGQLVISGQLPIKDGAFMGKGAVGRDLSVEEAQQVARQCGLNILAQAAAAQQAGVVITRLVRLGVFVHADTSFMDHPKVANGVSDLMVDVLGEQGKHARAAVGVSGLPFGVAVEVEALFATE